VSRLDSAIRRLQAQRACLDHVAALVQGVKGPVLEIGLGNGRTYDHLRERLPDRVVFVFERQVAAHPDCMPPPPFLILGDLAETLPGALARIGTPAALAHADIGSGRPEIDRETAAMLALHLPGLMTEGGVVASDQPLAAPRLSPLPLPAVVPVGRYYLYRRYDR
jgi:hypothetical protein